MAIPSTLPAGFFVPVLTSKQATFLSALLTSIYVGSLYLAKSSRIQIARPKASPDCAGFSPSTSTTRPEVDAVLEEEPRTLGRDDAGVMKSRMRAVGGATVACCLGIWGVVRWKSQSMGIIPSVSSLERRLACLSKIVRN